MALPFPRDLVADLYLGDELGWVDVHDRVRQTEPVVMTRGVKGEQGQVAPSSAKFHFENADGRFTLGNPTSPYYGLLNRNTPIRIGLRAARATFGIDMVNGWSAADTGQAWNHVSSGGFVASDYQTTGGKATHSIGATVSYRMSMLDVPVADCYVRVNATLPFGNVTGGPLEPANAILRWKDITHYYMVRPQVLADESITIEIRKSDGIDSLISDVVPVAGLTYSAGQVIWSAAMIEGETIRGKVWLGTLADEPPGWQVVAYDSSIVGAGRPGVRSGVGGGNTNTKPIVFSNDDFEVILFRFAGETVDFEPRWDESHRIKWVEVECASVLRRLSQSRDPGKSAFERWVARMDSTPAKSYWPLDDEELSIEGRELVQGPGSTTAFLNSPSPLFTRTPFGTGELAPWLRPSVVVNQGRALICRDDDEHVGSFNAHLMIKFKGIYTSSSRVDRIRFTTTGASDEWILTIESFSGKISIGHPITQAPLVDMFPPIFDDAAHHIGFYVTQDGADVNWSVFFDDDIYGAGTVTGYTARIHDLIALQADTSASSDNTRDRVVGHALVVPFDGNPFAVDVYEAMFGHVEETAGRRLERLTLEEGIALNHFGGLDDTQAMGPQFAEPVFKVLTECAATSLGMLYDTRGTMGLTYRPLSALVNRPVSVALDYSAGHLSAPFFPKSDDRHTKNVVTAKRRLGGEVVVRADSGPMNASLPEDDPQGVGPYPATVTVNVADDDQLADIASWVLRVGTAPEARFPTAEVNLRAPAVSALTYDLLALDVGDRLQVTDMAATDHYETVDLIVLGYTEVLSDAFGHKITFNGVPAAPYAVGLLDGEGRLESDGTFLDEDLTEAETVWDVSVPSGPLWITTATHPTEFPFDVVVGGERCTVTAVTTTGGTTQQFTCTRNVNGLPGGKAHLTGAPIELAPDYAIYLGL